MKTSMQKLALHVLQPRFDALPLTHSCTHAHTPNSQPSASAARGASLNASGLCSTALTAVTGGFLQEKSGHHRSPSREKTQNGE
eukprot:6210805-Amphidinium_carterae.2